MPAQSDDILDAATSAGYLPGGGSDAGTPSYADATGQPGTAEPSVATPGPPAQSEAKGVLGQIPQQVLGIPQPVTPNAVAAGRSLGSASAAVSGSSSTRRYETDRYKQITKDTTPEVTKAYADADARARALYAPAEADFEKANAEGKQAAAAEAKARSDAALEEGRGAQTIADLQTQYAAEEAKINEHYRAEANQAKADYFAALADFRSQRVNPDALWQGMDGGQKFGTLMAAFATDFLGAKGVHTSAMETLDKAISRNIDAQVQNIKQKGEVAEGFKTLWDMQRMQANSDAEARARVKSYMLEGAKQSVIARMAGFKSALATAEGQAASAKLDEALAKNHIEVLKYVDQSSNERAKQALELVAEKMKQATAFAQMATQVKVAQIQKQPEIAPPQDPRVGAIIDPWTNKYAYRLNETQSAAKPDEQAKTAASISKDLGKLKSIDDRFVRLAELSRAAGSLTGKFDKTRFANQAQAEFDALAAEVAGARAKDQDGRVNWNEIEAGMRGLRKGMTFAGYDSVKLIEDFRSRVVKGQVDQVKGDLIDLKDNDPVRQFGGAAKGGMYGALAEASAKGNPVEPDLKEASRNADLQALTSKDQAPIGDTSQQQGDVTTEVRNFRNFDSDAADRLSGTVGGSKVANLGGNKERIDNVRPAELAMVNLRNDAAKGDERALAHLIRQASPYFTQKQMGGGSTDVDPQSVFAAMMLYELHDKNAKFLDPELYKPGASDAEIEQELRDAEPVKTKTKGPWEDKLNR